MRPRVNGLTSVFSELRASAFRLKSGRELQVCAASCVRGTLTASRIADLFSGPAPAKAKNHNNFR
jgi:hypothetical protein